MMTEIPGFRFIILFFALKPGFILCIAMHPNLQSVNRDFTGSISLQWFSACAEGFEAASCELANFMVAITTVWSTHHYVPNGNGKKLGWTMQMSWCNHLFFKHTTQALHRTMEWIKTQWFTLRNTGGEILVWWMWRNTPSCSSTELTQCFAREQQKCRLSPMSIHTAQGLEFCFTFCLPLDNSTHYFLHHLDLR